MAATNVVEYPIKHNRLTSLLPIGWLTRRHLHEHNDPASPTFPLSPSAFFHIQRLFRWGKLDDHPRSLLR